MEPYLGEIRMFAGDFEPEGWAFCNGQQLAISANEALFSLIGTTYGGDGQQAFALPDLRGRAPAHQGQRDNGTSYHLGQQVGSETVTLSTEQLPSHTHQAIGGSGDREETTPTNNYWGVGAPYSNAAPDSEMSSAALSPTGGSLPHGNMSPFLTISYIIALRGVFPTPAD